MTARYFGTDITDSGTIAILAHDGDVITIGSAAHIVEVSEPGFGIGGISNVTVQVAGFVYGGGSGIGFGIPSIGFNFVTVTQSGTVMGGEFGIYVQGAAANVVDNGAISGGLEAIDIPYTGGGNTITVGHEGTLTGGQFAIHALGPGGKIFNDGAISGGVDALKLAGGGWTVDNTGTISATGAGRAISMTGGGRDVIQNTGHIAGAIVFSSGNDTYNGSLGNITGSVNGGAGNDTLKGGVNGDHFTGSTGNDILNGGAGDDVLFGGGGTDVLQGGAGQDIFRYSVTAQSTGHARDTVQGFDSLDDRFDLNVPVRAIDAAIVKGKLREGAHFDADLKAALGTHLKAHHAILFTANAGTDKGEKFLIVDGNGHAGYQAGADYVIELSNAAHLASLNVHDFI